MWYNIERLPSLKQKIKEDRKMKRNIFNVFVFSFCTLISHMNYLMCEEKYDKKLEEILLKVEDASLRLKTMEADIQYTRVISLLDSEEISHGELKYKKPKMMRINFFPPRNDVTVFNGSHIWIFHPEENQIEKYEMNDNANAPQEVDLFEFGYEYSVEKIKKKYTISLLDDITSTKGTIFHLELIPKDSTESQYSRILLWVNNTEWLPIQFQLFESDGEIINTIELSNIHMNSEIPDKTFSLELSGDVEILEPFK